ncbi:MAG: NAD kinase [Marinilabiliaceae bacterium]|nr:NAD kinase [Marinilabiliaceae bacterium]
MIVHAHNYTPEACDIYSSLIEAFRKNRIRAKLCDVLYQPFIDNGIATETDIQPLEKTITPDSGRIMLSIGGDGTFLEAAKSVLTSNIPILGINKGRLGFLSELQPNQISWAMGELLRGAYRTAQLDVLSVYEGDKREPIDYALNEFSVSKCDNSSMLTIHAYVDGDYLTTYWADGLIIATATGSTAYSLSVGGPIAYPSTPSFIITPIAPHNLSIRPIVVPNNVAIKLIVEGRGPKILTSMDGRTHLMEGDCQLRIGKSPFSVRRVQLEGHSFFATLRDKLMWGADRRNSNS